MFTYIRSILNILFYIFSDKREKINEDILRYYESYGIKVEYHNKKYLIRELVTVSKRSREFLSLFYFRIGREMKKMHLSTLLMNLFPSKKEIIFGISEENVKGGVFIQHGNSTIIHAQKIGYNFSVYQNVTIGDNGKGVPVIGNNVTIYTGAVVVGPIHIGDNAIIGANATIVKDVPANSTIIPSQNRIIRLNGKKLNNTLL